jgi:hypothetical protein
MKRWLPMLLLACGWHAAAVAREIVYFGEENYREHLLTAYSRAVSAKPMDANEGDQVRVWVMGYWSGRMSITGYIVTEKGVSRCRLSYNNDNGKYMVVNRGRCSGARNYPERLAQALAALPELAKHATEGASCETMDGWGADIEGMVDGKRFQFTASNPQDCESGRPVARMLELIENSYYKKDRK